MLPGFTGELSDEVIANLPVWGPGYEVSFEFYLHSDVPGDQYGYQWLIGVGGVDFYHINNRLALWFGFEKEGGNNGDTLYLWR